MGLFLRNVRGDRLLLNWAEPTAEGDDAGGYTLLVAQASKKPLTGTVPRSSVLHNFGTALLKYDKDAFRLLGSLGPENWRKAQAQLTASVQEMYA